ncbi:MAG: 6-carboxytetrahydropterin synthase QueD [Dissulfuribacterales bacterium]
MFEIFVRTHFSAAHYLRDYPGNCEHLHGHNWNVDVFVKANELDTIDVGIDFKILKRVVNGVLEELDHTNINDHPAFQGQNPSSERIAQYIFDRVEQELASHTSVRVSKVVVCETQNSGVVYTKD